MGVGLRRIPGIFGKSVIDLDKFDLDIEVNEPDMEDMFPLFSQLHNSSAFNS